MQNDPRNTGFLEIILRILNASLQFRKMYLWIVFIPTFAMVVVVYGVLKPRYTSSAIVAPPSVSRLSGFQGLFTDGLMGSILSNSMGSTEDLNIVWTFLHGKDLHDQVIEHFNLKTRYKFKGKYYADLLKKFRKRLGIDQNKEDMLEISFEDEDPKVARDVVLFMIQKADSMFRDYKAARAATMRDFFEKRTRVSKQMLDSVEQEFAAFQKNNKFYAPDAQLEATIRALSDVVLKRDELALESEIESRSNGEDSPRYRQLKNRKEAMDQYLAKMRHGTLRNIGMGKLEDQIDASFRYMEYETELKILTALYKLVRQRAEEFALEEAKKVNELKVLQAPWINNKKTSPPRMAMILLVFFLSNVAAMSICVFRKFISAQIEQQTELAREWMEIVQRLRK